MAFDNPPYIMDNTTVDAAVIRRALGSLISPAGGIVTPGDLAVTQQATPNMSVQIAPGQVWVPGTNLSSQGPYYSQNGAAITQAIATSNPSNPRVDTITAQVLDKEYTGSATTLAPGYVIGTPTAGATLPNPAGKGALPASSLVLAYVLVPAGATTIVTADISNVATPLTPAGRAAGGAQSIGLGNYGVVMGSGGSAYGAASVLQGGVTYSPTTGFFTVPAAGLYMCSGWVNLILNGSGQTNNAYWQVSLLHNGSGYDGGPAEGLFTATTWPYAPLSLSDMVPCAAGDTLGLTAAGADFSNTVSFNNYALNIVKVG